MLEYAGENTCVRQSSDTGNNDGFSMNADSFYRWETGNLILQLKIHARAKSAAWGKVLGSHMVVHVSAAPENGRATAKLLQFLADQFAVPAAQVQVIRGTFSPLKVIKITKPARLPLSVAPPPHTTGQRRPGS